jgi:hypothetical protein
MVPNAQRAVPHNISTAPAGFSASAAHNLPCAMDYCDQCRRHLNGALTCAGCGVTAEELRRRKAARRGPDPHRAPERYGTDAGDHEAYGGVPQGEREPLADDPLTLSQEPYRTGDFGDPAAGYPLRAEDPHHRGYAESTEHGAQAAPPGRTGYPAHAGGTEHTEAAEGARYGAIEELGGFAAGAADGGDGPGDSDGGPAAHGHRRGQGRARPKPRRARSRAGRRVVIGVGGLVLAAGVLSLAQLAIDPSGGTPPVSQGSDSSTSLDFDGAPSASDRPVPGAPLDVPTPGAGSAGGGNVSGSPDPSASGEADPSTSASGEASRPPSGGGAPTGGSTSSGRQSGAPGGPTAGGGGGTSGGQPVSRPPTPQASRPPAPRPSNTCKPILFWCA